MQTKAGTVQSLAVAISIHVTPGCVSSQQVLRSNNTAGTSATLCHGVRLLLLTMSKSSLLKVILLHMRRKRFGK
ncbi:MAG: hypothetical protein FD135_1170 [Comamonadaceae bacterium]|nr:MAG: hypothetical protein FD135_1170 [Comamonadaceae bacterium]